MKKCLSIINMDFKFNQSINIIIIGARLASFMLIV